jgi:hypothetical protein
MIKLIRDLLFAFQLYAISSAMSTSYKVELMTGTHNHTQTTGDVFKIALFTSSASLDASTTAYSSTNEVANGSGYTTGGFAWTAAQNITPTSSGTTAFASWTTNPSWTTATFTARGCQIYNSSKSNKSVATYDFGADKSCSSGTFTITLPTNDASNAPIRIG